MKVGVTKEQLIESLSETLKLTREGVDCLDLIGEDTVLIHFKGGHHEAVNIACNSGMAIIRDVAKRI